MASNPNAGHRRGLFGGAVLLLAGALTLLAAGAPSARADSCPNAPIRAAQGSTELPNCRAYEMVSPPEKFGRGVFVNTEESWFISNVTVAVDGNAVSFQSLGAFADAENGNSNMDYFARRGPEGWTTRALAPKGHGFISTIAHVMGWSSDLSHAAIYGTGEPLASGATVNAAANLYRQDLTTKAFEAVSLPGIESPEVLQNESLLFYTGASTDLSTIVFEDSARHTLDSPALAPTNAYAWRDGQVSLVTILPNGEPAPEGGGIGSGFGSASGGYSNQDAAVSKDGSRIFFSTPDGRIYVRKDLQATVEVSASQKSTPDPHQPATYRTASRNGRFAFFTTAEQLLDSDADSAVDLYRFDVDTGSLIRISGGAQNPENAGVFYVAAASDDGSRVYFTAAVANYDGLVPPGTGPFELYLWENGQLAYVADGGYQELNTNGAAERSTVRITPSGQQLVFTSDAPQPSAGNFNSEGTLQTYVYDAATAALTCVSCRTDGAAPLGGVAMPWGRDASRPRDTTPALKTRTISDDGRWAFFSSPDPLVKEDVNKRYDAYQYDLVTDEVHLLSTGLASDASFFVGLSSDGRDAVFSTSEKLVRRDRDSNPDLYDARVNGGFNEPPPAVPCTGESCKGTATTAPQMPSAGSSQFSGARNAKRAKQLKKKKLKKKQQAKKRKAKKRAQKSRGSSQGAGK